MRIAPVEVWMMLADEQGETYTVSWRPLLPDKRWFLQSVTVADRVGVPIVTVPFMVPTFSDNDHAFVEHADPRFGSAVGGGCGHVSDDGVTCGYPRSAHEPSREG